MTKNQEHPETIIPPMKFQMPLPLMTVDDFIGLQNECPAHAEVIGLTLSAWMTLRIQRDELITELNALAQEITMARENLSMTELTIDRRFPVNALGVCQRRGQNVDRLCAVLEAAHEQYKSLSAIVAKVTGIK